MAARTVLTSNTLEEFRTTFNSLSSTDIGDPATLTTTATSVIAAINELNSAVTITGFQIADDTSAVTQQIVGGDVFRISSGSNITATVSATDTLTVALDSTVSGLTSVSTSDLQATTATIGGISISGSQISSADSTIVQMEGLRVNNVSNAGTDTDKFLVTDISGNIQFRTGNEVASDIGATSAGFAIAVAVALG
jgi:ribosomal protein L27